VIPSLRRVACAALALALSGCALGPDYARPPLPEPPAFRGQPAPEATSIADLPWWEVFRDEALGALVREAVESNLDLLVAATRVEQARYLAAVTRSELLPQLGYEGDAASGAGVLAPSRPADAETEDSFPAVLSLAWEIDIWAGSAAHGGGAPRCWAPRPSAAASCSLISASRSPTSPCASSTSSRDRAPHEVSARRGPLPAPLPGRRGLKPDALRGEAPSRWRADPDLSAASWRRRTCSVLLGRPPARSRAAAPTEQWRLPEVPAGVPSLLLTRRPDPVEAEQRPVASNARVGAAFEFFPASGSLRGGRQPELGFAQHLERGGDGARAALHLRAHLLRLRFQGTDETVLAYEAALLTALQRFDALTAREKPALVRTEQERAVESPRGTERRAVRHEATRHLPEVLDRSSSSSRRERPRPPSATRS
jgi:multidrug efflux system outer membrane protein